MFSYLARVVLIAFVLTTALSAFSSVRPPGAPTPQEIARAQDDRNGNDNANNSPEFRIELRTILDWAVGAIVWLWRAINDAAGVMTLGFTAALVFVTRRLWFSTDKVASAAKQSAGHIPTVERAWVFGTPKISLSFTDMGTCNLVIKNHGKTPAFVKVIHAEFRRDEPFHPVTSYRGQPNQVQIVLSAGEPYTYPHGRMLINPEYMIGFIRYTDIFGDIQISRFCFRVIPNEDRFEMAGHPVWNEHFTEGNIKDHDQ